MTEYRCSICNRLVPEQMASPGKRVQFCGSCHYEVYASHE